MTLAEASRQYQSVLEAARNARTALSGVLSAADELHAVQVELSTALAVLELSWLERLAA